MEGLLALLLVLIIPGLLTLLPSSSKAQIDHPGPDDP